MKDSIEKFNEVTDYLIFTVGDNYYSVYTSSVVEVISEHSLTLLPFVPDYIDGLINIKGQVIPQLNLRKFFLTSNNEENIVASELIIVETSRSPCALKIDSLIGKFSIDNKAIKNINSSNEDELNTEKQNDEDRNIEEGDDNNSVEIRKFISGEFFWNNEIVLVLESRHFGEVINSKESLGGNKGLLGKNEDLRVDIKNENLECLVVNNGQEKYALKLQDIMEIIETEDITSLPGSPDEIVGITMVRNNPLVVLSLSVILGKSKNNSKTIQCCYTQKCRLFYIKSKNDY